MNPHSLPPPHSPSSFNNHTTSHGNIPYHPPFYRPRLPDMSYRQHHQQSPHPHLHPYPHQTVPWVASSSSVVAPPVLQEVYILDCKSCDTFLTNRGMRAVLLLQPDVPLYSSDALPVNCSANPGPPEYAPHHDIDTNDSSALICPAGMPTPAPRTCECLTQTLCCHGCGTAVGYMVVIPCHRCCSSVSPTNRHTNRHRFVFFNKEIKASERHYIPHEPGIVGSPPLLVSAIIPSSSVSSSPSSPYDSSAPSSPSISHNSLPQFRHSAGSTVSLPTPPSDSQVLIEYAPTSPALHASPPSPSSRHHAQFPFQFVMFKPDRGKLRAGDVIYWHNLTRNGEIPAVVEDERARHTHASISPWAGR